MYNLATNDGARITQWTRNDGNNQQWQFVDSGGGYYRLKSRHSGKVLDVYNFSTADGGAIVQWTDHNGTNQQFRLADSDSGYVRLINRNSNKAARGAGRLDRRRRERRPVRRLERHQPAMATRPRRQHAHPPGWSLPSSFRWSSSGVLAGPKPDPRSPTSRPSRTSRSSGTTASGTSTPPPPAVAAAGTWCTSRSRTGRRRPPRTHTYLDTATADRHAATARRRRCSTSRRRTCGTWSTRPACLVLDQHATPATRIVDDAAELHEQRCPPSSGRTSATGTGSTSG